MTNGGFGRLAVMTLVNAIIVLFVASFLISAVFIAYGEQYLKGVAEEAAMQYARALERSGKQVNFTEIKQLFYEKYGLTRPVVERILVYVWRTFTLDFSDFPKAPQAEYPNGGENALDVVLRAMVPTLILFTTAQIIVIIIGIYLGFQSARKPGSLLDKFISTTAMVSASLPMWWVGLLMLYIFSFHLRMFPIASTEVYAKIAKLSQELAAGKINIFEYYVGYIYQWFYHMSLPLITIVLVLFGSWAYIVRNIVIGVMAEDFVIVARAKGLPERLVLYKHVLRTASPPIVTMTALALIGSLGGAIITETVFQWPGSGLTYWIALNSGDQGVLVVQTYIFVLLFVITISILDFIYMLLDPRVRIGGRVV
ncbi:MAG: ABC transporter permease [Pyrodictiaceae archaeon]